jgi:hypothetical protein
VGALRGGAGSVLRLRAVDAATGVPVGQPLSLTRPGDGPYFVLDAWGTLLLVDLLVAPGEGSRPVLVPIDPVAGVTCPAGTVSLPGLAARHARILAMHFEGDTAGVAIDTSGGTARRLFFTRLRCAR